MMTEFNAVPENKNFMMAVTRTDVFT